MALGYLALIGQLVGTGVNLYQGYEQMGEGEELAEEGRRQMLATAGATDELLASVDEQKRLVQQAGDLGQQRLDQSVTSLLDALASGDPSAYSAIPAFGQNQARAAQDIGLQTASSLARANAPAVEAAEAEMDVYRGLAQYDLQQGTAAYQAGQQTVNQAYGDLFNMPMDMAALQTSNPEAYGELFGAEGLKTKKTDNGDVIRQLARGGRQRGIIDMSVLSEEEKAHQAKLEEIEREGELRLARKMRGLPLEGAAGLVYTGGGIESSSFRDLIGGEEGSDEEEKKEGYMGSSFASKEEAQEYLDNMSERERARYERQAERELRKDKRFHKRKGYDVTGYTEDEDDYRSGGKIQDYIGGGSTLSQVLRPGQSFKTGGVEDHDVQEYNISDANTGQIVAKTTGQEDHMVNEDGSLTVINSEQNESIHDAFKDIDVEMVLQALERNPQKKNVRELLSALNKVFRQKQFQS